MMNTSCGAVYIGGDDRSINTHLSAHHHYLRTRYLRKSAAAKHEQPTVKIRYQLKFSKLRITLTVIQMILFLHLVIQSQFTVNFYYFLAHHHYEIFISKFYWKPLSNNIQNDSKEGIVANILPCGRLSINSIWYD